MQGFAIGAGASSLVVVFLRSTLNTWIPELENWTGRVWLEFMVSTSLGVYTSQLGVKYRTALGS